MKVCPVNIIRLGVLWGVFAFELCHAGREPEAWDTLPQVDNIRFSKESIGFSTFNNRFFILDRELESFGEVSQNDFIKRLQVSKDQKSSAVLTNTGNKTSDGTEFQTSDAYCSEGENLTHTLSHNGKAFHNHVAPCYSISAIEKTGDQLWLGTRLDGEYGHYPAEGIVVQSFKSGKLIKKIDSKSRLTGDLVRVIRNDPYGNNVWVATHLGLNKISQNLIIMRSYYFYEDFDERTGKATVFLESSKKLSNPLAVIELELAIERPKEFHEAVKKIPREKLKGFSLYNFHSGIYHVGNARGVETSFVPKEMNILVPFFIEAARSANHAAKEMAVSRLCIFNDRQVIDFFIELDKNSSSDRLEKLCAKDCIDKFKKLGLLETPEH